MAPNTGTGRPPLPPPPSSPPPPSPPPPPLATKNGVGWIVIAFLILLGLLVWALFPKSVPPVNPNYNPAAICPTPAPKPVDRSLNNPLGIKFDGDFIKRVAEDSGNKAQDGGTFAKFSAPEIGLDAGKQLLRSKTGIYAGKTVDWSMRKWSHGGYGAEVASGTGIDPDAKVNDLPEAHMDALLAAMAKREHTSPAATAILVVNPNDHYLDHIEEFTVEPPSGCFDNNWVIAPRYWKTWVLDFVSDDPTAKVGIWFFGWSTSQGPFAKGVFPDYYHPPSNRWRLQSTGKGGVRIRYVQTS